MKRLLLRPLAWAGALALLPACWAVTAALLGTAPGVFLHPGPGRAPGLLLSPGGWALAGGALAYLVWHRLRPPEFLYTFAHEFTHLAFALLLGKRVSRFEVARGMGQVALSGTNPLITLAPYFFPLPAALALGAGALLALAVRAPWVGWLTAFAVGFALALHVTMTWRTLRTAQPDIARSGRFFSGAVIWLAGVAFAGGAALAAAGGSGALAEFGRLALSESAGAYRWSAGQAAAALALAAGWAWR
ncbi:MAG: M50 family metallopeptidase [Nitrospinota bacterium]